jgi:uncharacterized protein (DUF736 family)
MVRPQNRKETSMTTIGTFKQDETGFVGAIATLTVKAKATFRRNAKAVDNAPDYRVYASGVEIGAAWSKKSEANKPYLSVKLDDPSFAGSIFCRLVGKDDGDHILVWSR